MGVSTSDVLELMDKDVFTIKGYYAGKVSDCKIDLGRYKIQSLIVQTTGDSIFGKMFSGKKGVVIPYPLVQAIGDIVIIKHVEKTETQSSSEQPVEAV